MATPLDNSVKLLPDIGAPLSDPSIFRRIVGKLKFLQHTCPDIVFSIQHLRQFLQAPQVPHMLAPLHMLRYLSGAPDLGIFLSNSPDLFSFGILEL